MADFILMPQMGVSEESALLANWIVKEGDTVKTGDPLFSLETGKSSFEELSKFDGTVLKILVPAGEEVTIGVPVAVVGKPGEKFDLPAGSAPAAAPTPSLGAPEAAAAAPAAAPAAAAPAAAAAVDGDKVLASPRAKKLASDLGLDIANASATGPEGRVIERDVKALAANPAAPKAEKAAPAAAPAAAAPTAEAEYEDQPISRLRKVIAENMHSSLANMAQLTLNRTFDATALNALRKQMKASEGYGLEKVTINDLVLYVVARTLPEFPDINANFIDDKMRRFKHAQLGVAVDTPRGLLVPVIRDADKLSIREISQQVKAMAGQCRDGAISPAQLSGGSFTVTNLGSLGIESFTPIINPPQTAILGVCGLTLRPRETADGEIEFYTAMGLSLTFDHRVVDGSPAAQFLKAVATRLENINLLMAM